MQISGFSSYTQPQLFNRQLTGYSVKSDAKELLESNSFFKSVDLISEGPIEGFCDYTGKLVSGSDILKGVYLNDVPVKTTSDGPNDGLYNFRNIAIAYKNGEIDQSGLYTGQGLDGPDSFYWMEDFSYSSNTKKKEIRLYNSKSLNNLGAANQFYMGAHTVVDQDVDWLCMTVRVDNCYFIDTEGNKKPNQGNFHIYGDITGVAHRSFDKGEVKPILDSSQDDYNAYLKIKGIATSSYKEDIFFKLKDLSGVRPRTVYIENLTPEDNNFRTNFNAVFDSVTEINNTNLSYPGSAYVGMIGSAEALSEIPRRTYDLKLKKVKVPSNYEDLGEGVDGPLREDRHPGIWNGTFKTELEWTDNPAWILYDLITNDRYGLGEYIDKIKIDKFQLYKIAKVCDELVNTSKSSEDPTKEFIKERRYSCNLLLSNAMDAYAAINEISSIFRGIAYFDSNEIFISQNSLKESIFNFNNSNVVEGNFLYSGPTKRARFTAVKVSYKDKEDSFLPKYEYVEDPEGIIRYGLIEKEISAVGCTSRDQALRLGRWTLLSSNLEKETVSFATSSEAEYLSPGDVFSVSDKLKNGIKQGGRILKIVNDQPVGNQNYILLDQQIDTGNFNFSNLNFLIPEQDLDLKTEQFKSFIHRNGVNIGSADDGTRNATYPDLHSTTSSNTSLHNYIENTPSGAKILTDELQDLILEKTGNFSLIDNSNGHKTLNDYFLDDSVLINFLRGSSRVGNTQKIKEGTIYTLDGTGDGVDCVDFSKKEYTLISKQESSNGSFQLMGTEYNSGKFSKVDNLSTIYTSTTFNSEATKRGRKPEATSKTFPAVPLVELEQQQVLAKGYPKENTVDLIVRPSGFINSQGESKSKVFYYFHNTEINQEFYDQIQSSDGKYVIRAQEISESYYSTLKSSIFNSENIVQNGQYLCHGEQECGNYEVIYEPNIGSASIEDKATVGGASLKQLSLTNFKDSEFNEEVSVVRPRVMSETGEMQLSGCDVFGVKYLDQTTGNVLSGEFEVSNPNAYYELRWSEVNRYGGSPEKIMLFRAAVDNIPPSKPTNFSAKINQLFPNLINFEWDNQKNVDPDLAGFRIYTGYIGANDPDYEFDQIDSEGNPIPGSEFAEIRGNHASYFTYEADTREGVLKNLSDKNIGFNDSGIFHIRSFDYSQNLSEPSNQADFSITQFANAPDLFLSGQVKAPGEGTDSSRSQVFLHAFYSGSFHETDSFSHYSIRFSQPNNGLIFNDPIIIKKDQIVVANSSQFTAGNSGHIQIPAQANSTYQGLIHATTNDGRLSPEGTDSITIGKDEEAPSALRNFQVTKQFSNFKFSWDTPEEADCEKILLFTGSGHNNFDLPKPHLVGSNVSKIDSSNSSAPKFELVASVFPDDPPVFSIDKFRNEGQEPWEKTNFPFHAVPVDTSNNTGMYTGFTFTDLDLDAPFVHTSGEITSDNRSLIHVFYSGNAQNDGSFKYYLTEYADTSDGIINSYEDRQKASHNLGKIGLGSGSFSFEAKGGHAYDVKTKIVTDLLETDFADDTILTDSLGSDILAFSDNKAPAPIGNFQVTKQFSNFKFSWDTPEEADCEKILLFTGSGHNNFDLPKPHLPGSNVPRIDSSNSSAPKFELIASVFPDDPPVFSIDKFREKDQEPWEKTNFPFHIVPVDTSNNTGMYTGFTFTDLDLDAPFVHTSGEITPDNRSLIHVFYSGNAQNDGSFKYYLTEHTDVSDGVVNSYEDRRKASYDTSKPGLGSGSFSFEARGGHAYDIRTKIVTDLLETDFADDTILTNSLGSDIIALPDDKAPAAPEWKISEKNGSNIFLSWDNPSESDLDRILLYTGSQNFTGKTQETEIYKESKFNSEIVPLLDFGGDRSEDLYFWLRAVDSSNNTGNFSVGNTSSNLLPHNSGQEVSISRVSSPSNLEITLESGIYNNLNGDGSSYAYINYIIEQPLDYETTSYKVDVSRFSDFNPIAGSQVSMVDYGTVNMTGSGVFNNLLSNERYYLRFRTHEKDGRYSAFSNNHIVDTPKDESPPINPDVFTITSGPKQNFLEWEWGNGISRDVDSILIYKTGIPTGRLNETSSQNQYCWKTEDISGYFETNAEAYSYKLNPGTSFIDNDVETGVFSGYGIAGNIHDEPRQPVLYHYFLKTVDRSNNTGVGFVSGISSSPHSDFAASQYSATPHNIGYVTGGGIDDSYIENVRAGKILTDRITSNTLILANPSGRIVSDEVYAENTSDQRMAYSVGEGLYVDHKMFRIGDPEGGQGLFWTGEYNDSTKTFETPTWDIDGNLQLDPNILEIRGNMTAGSITIGSDTETQFRVDNEGQLSIGNQSSNITGFFTGGVGTIDVSGTNNPVVVQANFDEYKNNPSIMDEIGGAKNGFLQITYPNGEIEVRGIQGIGATTLYDYEGKNITNASAPDGVPLGRFLLNSPALSSGVWNPSEQNISYRPTWRIIDVKFLVTNDGTLYAQDASIAGTITANNFEARKTIILGDENDITNNLSVMQSFGYTETNNCNDTPYGWQIRGDGTSLFKSTTITSGAISGVSLAIGECEADNFFRVNNQGDLSIGDSLIPRNNNFYVSNDGKLRSRDAVISGDLWVTGNIKVGDGLLLAGDDSEGILLDSDSIRTSSWQDDGSTRGFKIHKNGRASFHDLFITGGSMSGMSINIGTHPNVFRVNNQGDLSIGSSLTARENNFFVSREGDLRSRNAVISGDLVVTGTIDVKEGLLLAGDDSEGILLDSDSIRTSSWQDDGSTRGFKIHKNGKATFHDLSVTGGFMSGVAMTIGNATDGLFKVNSAGEIGVGSKNATSSISESDSNFYVSKLGDLYAKSANITGYIRAEEGIIGSLYLGDTYVSTYSKASNSIRKDLEGVGTGLFLDREGKFSIKNDVGHLIGWQGSNEYLTITGLVSSHDLTARYSSTETNGRGLGFHLNGLQDGASYISNFATDSFSASGIAKKVDTQLCGEIAFPIDSQKYSILTNSSVQYEILSFSGELTNAALANIAPPTAHTSFPIGAGASLNITIGSNVTEGSNLILQMPSDVKSAEKYRFNIGLKRS